MEKPHISGYRHLRRLKLRRQLTGNWRDLLLAVLAVALLLLVNLRVNQQPAQSASAPAISSAPTTP